MIKLFAVNLALGCSALLLAGCGGNDAKENTPLPAKVDGSAKAQMREVWLQVDGMSERLAII